VKLFFKCDVSASVTGTSRPTPALRLHYDRLSAICHTTCRIYGFRNCAFWITNCWF